MVIEREIGKVKVMREDEGKPHTALPLSWLPTVLELLNPSPVLQFRSVPSSQHLTLSKIRGMWAKTLRLWGQFGMDILRLGVLQPGWLRDASKRSGTCHSETLLITKDFTHWENEVVEKAGVYCVLMLSIVKSGFWNPHCLV